MTHDDVHRFIDWLIEAKKPAKDAEWHLRDVLQLALTEAHLNKRIRSTTATEVQNAANLFADRMGVPRP